MENFKCTLYPKHVSHHGDTGAAQKKLCIFFFAAKLNKTRTTCGALFAALGGQEYLKCSSDHGESTKPGFENGKFCLALKSGGTFALSLAVFPQNFAIRFSLEKPKLALAAYVHAAALN